MLPPHQPFLFLLRPNSFPPQGKAVLFFMNVPDSHSSPTSLSWSSKPSINDTPSGKSGLGVFQVPLRAATGMHSSKPSPYLQWLILTCTVMHGPLHLPSYRCCDNRVLAWHVHRHVPCLAHSLTHTAGSQDTTVWAAWYVETPGLVFEGPDIGASAASAAFSPVRFGPQLHTPDGLPASPPPWSPSFLIPLSQATSYSSWMT